MKNKLKLILQFAIISLVISLVTGIPSIKSQSDHISGKYPRNNNNNKMKDDSSWLYLGQTPPGITPELFPPDDLLGNSIWFWHGSPVFSPDGMELFMSRIYIGTTSGPLIYWMEVIDQEWTTPAIPEFCGAYSCNSPFFTTGGDTLFFTSRHPETSVYFTTKNANNWATPIEVNIPIPAQSYLGNGVCVTKNKTLYFELSISGDDDLYKSEYINGQYSAAINLGPSINSYDTEFGLYIDPDEQYIIYSSLRSGGYGASDLYISTKDSEGNWTNSQNLGSAINSDKDDFGPHVTSDGKYFFFCTEKENVEGYNPYWADISVLDPFIVSVKDNGKCEIIFQNYPNPFNQSTTISINIPHNETKNTILSIRNVKGQKIRQYSIPCNQQSIIWDRKDEAGRRVPKGVYFYEILSGNYSSSKKMIVTN